jgi:hypothetical protein
MCHLHAATGDHPREVAQHFGVRHLARSRHLNLPIAKQPIQEGSAISLLRTRVRDLPVDGG